MEDRLYEASRSGNVEALRALIQENPLLLDRVSSSSFEETPLHVAALHGHYDFVKSLLALKPKLAAELDASGSAALHVASDGGHVEIVRELLLVNADVCEVVDKYGRAPLHQAVVKGLVEVVRELVRARPEAVRVRVDLGSTVFHLCVKNCCSEVLRFLVEFVEGRDDGDEIVMAQDDDGNTILHLAVMLKQVEVVKYLLSTKSGQEMASSENLLGLTVWDTLEHSPRDLKSMEIRDLLPQSDVAPRPNKNPTPKLPKTPSTLEAKLKKLWRIYRKSDTSWIEDSRGHIMVVATLTADMAFQAGTSPPWSKNDLSSDQHVALTTKPAGNDQSFTSSHDRFLVYNTVSFVASLTVILLTISGVPLTSKFSLWALMVALCVTVTFTALTYLKSLDIITPDAAWEKVDQIYNPAFYVLIGVFLFVFVVYTVRILVWVVVKLYNMYLVGPAEEKKHVVNV